MAVNKGTEISFCRLLEQCEKIANGDAMGKVELEHWQTSPLYHHYVDTLQEMLLELQSSPFMKNQADKAQVYKERVQVLSKQLQEPRVPSYCRLFNVKDRIDSGAAASTSAAPVLKLAELPDAPSSDGLRQRSPPTNGIQLSEKGKQLIQTHDTVQDAISDELLTLASKLKHNTLAIEQSLKERGQFLEQTDDALSSSLENATLVAKRAKEEHARGRRNFCMTCLVLIMVGLTFAGMYMFIKITSFAGYRKLRAKAAAAAAAAQRL